jgi:hypothetical protein
MADISIQMTQRNAANTAWDNLNPKTIGANVSLADTTNVFTATTVEAALLELFTNANNGKTAIANAVNAKGVPATSVDTFSVLAAKIGTASLVNTADATVVAGEMLSGKTGYKNGAKITGTIPNYAGTSHDSASIANYGNGDVAVYLASGGYYTPGVAGSGGAEVRIPAAQSGLASAKILSGQACFGLGGTAPNITNNAATPSGGYDGDYWVQP